MNKKEILMQPNNIIKGKYTCTALENKLFYKILFNAQKQNKDSSKYTCTLTKNDFKDVLRNNNDLIDKNINDMLIVLHQTILEFDYIDKDTGSLITYKSGLIGESKHIHDDDTYKITLHETLYKHITDFIEMQKVGNGYTPLNLELIFRFKGAYTQRLYTFFRSWSRQSEVIEVKYKLKDLRDYLKLNPDMYPAYKYFKQNVLKRALKEINENGNMHVEIKDEIRKNRKVDEIVFSVIDHEPRKYFEKNNNDIEKIIEKPKESEIVATMEIIEFYVPNKKLFTAKTLDNFKNDFSCYDFKDNVYKKLLQESILIALEKDDEEKIKANSYNYFKTTLNNKINTLVSKQNELQNKSSIPTVKTRFHNINQTFNKYSPDELEKILQESQKGKFK